MYKVISCFTIVILVNILFISVSISYAGTKRHPASKITPEELVAKHLDSIGTRETRDSFRSFMAIGTSKATFKGNGTAEIVGLAVLASQREKNMIGMKFESNEYNFEKLGFDGESLTVGYARPGIRTPFGNFLLTNANTFKIGILGGTLSNSWELLNYNEKRGKLKFDAVKTIEGLEVYRFSYNPSKGSELDIKLYFDTGTFRHVRTEYNRVISATLGRTIDESARQSETRYKMIEKFSDFRPEGGRIVPHNYIIELDLMNGTSASIYEWNMILDQFIFDQELEVSQFRVDSY